MEIKSINKNGENILPICFYGKNRKELVLSYHKKVMDFWNIQMNYLEMPFESTGHGNCIQWFIDKTINLDIDYWWFLDMDCIPTRPDFVDILYSKISDKQTIFAPALATNHRNFKDHIYAAAFCLSFSKQLYLELGYPMMTDTIERSDTGQELTWKAQEAGKNICFMYPSSFVELTDEEMKETGNPRYFNLGNYHKYGMSTQYGTNIFHGFVQNIKRSNENFIKRCQEILGENNKQRKNEAIIVSCGFSDFLEITLPLNKDKFDDILVITSLDDPKTIEICEQNNIDYFKTNLFYKDGALFNKGLAISESFQYLQYKDIITIIDSDIVLPNNFKEKLDIQNFDNNKFYGGGRTFIYTYEDWLYYKNGIKNIQDFQFIKGVGNGYLQIFNYQRLRELTPKNQSLYSSNPQNVQIDIDVLKRFCPLIEHDPNLIDLNIDVIHLGLHSIWKNGRDKSRFDYFQNKKFKDIKRDEIEYYIKEINK